MSEPTTAMTHEQLVERHQVLKRRCRNYKRQIHQLQRALALMSKVAEIGAERSAKQWYQHREREQQLEAEIENLRRSQPRAFRLWRTNR